MQETGVHESTARSSPPVSRGLWGDRFTRHGGPVIAVSTLLLGVTGAVSAGFAVRAPWLSGVTFICFLLWLFVLSFFRNPGRQIPEGADCVVAPADGKVISVTRVDDEEYIGGPATRISIFLSVFNVHVNRAPVAGVVEYLRHRRGTFRNTLDPAARETNECQAIGQRTPDGTPVLTRQIAGLIARRIVCPIEEGHWLEKGFDFGMIRFGSQTEVSIPDRGSRAFRTRVEPGDPIRGGETILGEW